MIIQVTYIETNGGGMYTEKNGDDFVYSNKNCNCLQISVQRDCVVMFHAIHNNRNTTTNSVPSENKII